MQNLKVERNKNNVELKQAKKMGRGKREIGRVRGRERERERHRELGRETERIRDREIERES